MKKRRILTGFLLLTTLRPFARAEDYPKADKALAAYDKHAAEVRESFDRMPEKSADKEWVKKKLAHLAEMDQYAFKYKYPFKFDAAETKYFEKNLGRRVEDVIRTNIRDLKKLVDVYSWFKISEFGEQASKDAAVVVQHADDDVDFQRDVLKKMEMLYADEEVSRKTYAFLYDRVAVHRNEPQRYGTQGFCTGPGVWEPCLIMEPNDPASVDARRKEATIDPASMEEYTNMFKTRCREGFKDVCRLNAAPKTSHFEVKTK